MRALIIAISGLIVLLAGAVTWVLLEIYLPLPDSAQLAAVGAVSPTPTNTPLATNTPTPTDTPAPTATTPPTATSLPTPTPAPTKSPTATPVPTATATQSPAPVASSSPTGGPSSQESVAATPPSSIQSWGIVTATALNVRSGPGTNYSVIGKFSGGDCVAILASSNGWLQATLPDGQIGWSADRYVNLGAECPGAQQPLNRVEAIPSTPTPAPAIREWTPPAEAQPQSCCKICRKGKACGDSCISRSYTCHVGSGCACDG